jgi:hypothetical protein
MIQVKSLGDKNRLCSFIYYQNEVKIHKLKIEPHNAIFPVRLKGRVQLGVLVDRANIPDKSRHH